MRLAELFDRLDTQGRAKLAEAAGTSPAYLYQMARKIRRPSLEMIGRLVNADQRLKQKDLVSEFMPTLGDR